MFGDDHPRTLKAADNLAAAQRLLSEAEPDQQDDSDPTANTDRQPKVVRE